VDAAAQSIAMAPDPSAAVAAYAAANTPTANPAAIEDAYVHRMVDFNMPDLAYAQAQDLIRRDPHNSVSRAVIAYVQGRRGQVVDALTTIVGAAVPPAPNAPIDPFVLRTAGQLVAWYDTRADKSQIPPAVQQSVEQMRHAVSTEDAYSQAYEAARATYQGGTVTIPLPRYTPAAPSAPVATPDMSSSSGYDSGYSYSPSTYSYEPYYYPTSSLYWNNGYYGGYGYGYYSPVVIHDHHYHDWDHGHDHDGDHGHDHNWDHGHDGSHMVVPHGETHFSSPSSGTPSVQHIVVAPPSAAHVDIPSAPSSHTFTHDDGGSSHSGGTRNH
jgi:hypothetical protein